VVLNFVRPEIQGGLVIDPLTGSTLRRKVDLGLWPRSRCSKGGLSLWICDELRPRGKLPRGRDYRGFERRMGWGLTGPHAVWDSSYLVDPASSHMLVSKIKPCMSKYKQICTVKLRMAH
jgi:hypothetical protein